MKKEIEIIPYDRNKGLELFWEPDFKINVEFDNEVLISANKQGLISLASHLLSLAQDEIVIGTHIHLDEFNSLEDGSCDLVIEKIE